MCFHVLTGTNTAGCSPVHVLRLIKVKFVYMRGFTYCVVGVFILKIPLINNNLMSDVHIKIEQKPQASDYYECSVSNIVFNFYNKLTSACDGFPYMVNWLHYTATCSDTLLPGTYVILVGDVVNFSLISDHISASQHVQL